MIYFKTPEGQVMQFDSLTANDIKSITDSGNTQISEEEGDVTTALAREKHEAMLAAEAAAAALVEMERVRQIQENAEARSLEASQTLKDMQAAFETGEVGAVFKIAKQETLTSSKDGKVRVVPHEVKVTSIAPIALGNV